MPRRFDLFLSRLDRGERKPSADSRLAGDKPGMRRDPVRLRVVSENDASADPVTTLTPANDS